MSWTGEQAATIRAQVGRMAASPVFASAGRMGALLTYIAEAELEGSADKLNQSRIAIDVFGRDGGFDPSADSIVRVEMGRLRTKLREYYSGDGASDAVVIDLPKGRYKPAIDLRGKSGAAASVPMKQDIRFCHAADGTNIAYALSGAGPPLVKTSNWLTHLEQDSNSPVWRHWWNGLADRFRLLRYDPRGCGLSDWDPAEITFDKWVSDFETVVEAAAPERFTLLGTSQGAPIAIAYAARHPERVTRLILYGGFARGRIARGEGDTHDLLQEIVRVGWGKPHGAFRQVFGALFMPEGTAEQFKWFDELSLVSMTAANAERTRSAAARLDVTADLARIKCPTLILHARDEILVPFSEARLMAAGIPNARLVALDSKNHLIMEHEPAWAHFLAEVEDFAGGRRD